MADLEKSVVFDKNAPVVDGIDAAPLASPATAGADEALKYASDEPIHIDEATDRRLLRATDLHVLPWLCALYFMQYMDKGM